MKINLYNDNPQQLAELKKIALQWDFWPANEVAKLLKDNHYKLYFFSDRSGWIGCVFYQIAFDVADLLYIFVSNMHRSKGVGQQLLMESVNHLKKLSVTSLLLEVRGQNIAAIKLYEKCGMKAIDSRQKYYKDGEDAIIYQFEF